MPLPTHLDLAAARRIWHARQGLADRDGADAAAL